MVTFTYMAYDSEGRKVFGAKKAGDEAAVKEQLSQKGYHDSQCFESKTKYKRDSYQTVSPKELSIFCRQMSVLFFSEITFMEGVALLSEQSENSQLKTALDEIYAHRLHGKTFAESMGMYEHIFTKYLVNMVFVGEASGTLENIFSIMSTYFEKEEKTKKKIRSAVFYPAMLSVLMGAIVMLLILKILPMFQETLYNMGYDIPGITKVILDVSSFINMNFVLLAVLVIALIAAISFFIRTGLGKAWLDKAKATYPVSRYIYARIITTRFSRSVSILLKSGVQLLNALEETRTLYNNTYIESLFATCAEKVKSGGDLTEALTGMNLFPPLFLKVVTIGQMTGHLDEMLEKSADVFENEVDESLDRFRAMIEPILIMILSGVVGIILISVMLPMISIMNNIA
jgi:type IV pilus assembly protein PilC